MASLSAIGGVLAQRNARIFYSGSIVCWTGSWIQRIATDWLAWELTHSALWVAIIAFCNLAPSVVISPIAGAVADRMDRVRLTMASQFVTVAQAMILVALILTGLIRVEFMAFLTLCNGAAETFAQPARQCLIPGLVPRSHLPGAVALNSLDLQRRALRRAGDLGADDRDVGRGAVDRGECAGVSVCQPDDAPADAWTRRSGAANRAGSACCMMPSTASAMSRGIAASAR